MSTEAAHPIAVRSLTMAYGSRTIMQDLNFSVERGSVFVIMGPSGCGKSTLMRHLIGLQEPASGTMELFGHSYWELPPDDQSALMRRVGILYQRCGLWSSMTLRENIALPLRQYTSLSETEIDGLCELKLSLVGLSGFGDYYPSEISGGMQKRAGLARAMALDPELLFFDEPSAGLDPVSAHNLDQLILELRSSLNTTIVVVTHDLDSIFNIATDAIFLDPATKSILEHCSPAEMLAKTQHPAIREFLTRGKENRA